MKTFWEIYVADIAASERFYVDILGLTITRRLEDFLVFESGPVKMHICSNEYIPECISLENAKIGAGVEFCFEVDNIEDFHRQFQSTGYPIYQKLQIQDWGKTDFRVMDPDGAYIRISSPRIYENKFKNLELNKEDST